MNTMNLVIKHGSMMNLTVEIVHGDILRSKDDVVVNTVNCVGVMGAGLAKQFKEYYPDMYDVYREYCREGSLKAGDIYPWWCEYNPPIFIINAATKYHWKSNSSYEIVEMCLDNIMKFIEHKPNIKTISIPPLGASLGGLSKDRVYDMVKEKFEDLRFTVHFYRTKQRFYRREELQV